MYKPLGLCYTVGMEVVTAGEIVGTKPIPKLTRKQTAFIRGVVIDKKSGTQAALAAYDTDNPKVANTIAAENMAKPSVREAIEQALTKQGLTMEVIAGEMRTLAMTVPDKVSGEVKLRSLVELLKLHNAYPDKKTMHLGVSLKGKIKEMDYNKAKEHLMALDNEAHTIIDSQEAI